MNLKSNRTGFALFLTIAIVIGLALTMNAAAPTDTGPYVDEHWWKTIKSPDARLISLITHDVDAGEVPYPEHIPELQAAGFTICSTVRYGYNMLFMNNLVYPADDLEMRKAIIRLCDKAALDELLSPLSKHLEYWLPESMPQWINPDAKLPLYDPLEADAILNAAGYVYSTVPTPAGWYDPDVPGSQPYYRLDPDTGQRMADFEYVTRPYMECPWYAPAMTISDRLHAMGIPSDLTPKSWTDIVYILVNSDYYDYSLLQAVGIVWGSPAPDILYDFFRSDQRPLWNICNFADAEVDEACDMMRATLDIEEMREAVYLIQERALEYVPFVPMMQYATYTAQTGPYLGNADGATKIVNSVGAGAKASCNEFGMEFGEAGRVEGGKKIYKHFLGEELDTLNPLMAETPPDWQVLDCVFGDFFRLNPYTQEYQWRAVEGMPTLAEWTGPGGEAGMTLEYTLRDNVKWHDGTPVTAEDCVFALNLMRFQENERYLSTWQPIYDVKTTGTYSFKIWLLQRYVFAHEWFGISLLAPKHIWEPWVDSPETGEPLVISEGTGPMGGDVWILTGRHHSQWEGWEYENPIDPSLTCLVGTDNFVYRYGGWDRVSATIYVEAWKDAENYVERINPGDCNIDQIVDMRDVYYVLHHQGIFTGQCYPVAIGGDPRWNSIADIAPPAQKIIGDEIVLVQSNFGATWGP